MLNPAEDSWNRVGQLSGERGKRLSPAEGSQNRLASRQQR